MFGADVEVLRNTARRFSETSELLRRHRVELTAVLHSTAWVGPDAEASRAEWRVASAPALARTSEFVAELGRSLLVHADAQQQASAARGPHGSLPPVTTIHGAATHDLDEAVTDGVADAASELFAATRDAVTDVVAGVGDAMTDVAAGIGHVTDGLVGGVDDTLGRLFGGLGPATHDDRAGPITGQRPARFDRPADGRAVLLAAMGGFADEGRIGRDEIEIRALDNGRYIVVLPGVTDLSQGFDRFAEQVREDGLFGVPEGSREAYDTWADNDEPTVRKMRYAYEAALRDDTTVNEYSTVVIDAMQAVGVPAGSEVMIVGHSFGAYTAIDLAVEPTFNGGAVDGYHVDVTHVVAAGAETDWRFDELPATTNALVLNNRWDAVYQAENLLHANASPTRPGHLEVEFWGDRVGYGHDEQNYIEWVAESDHRRVARWLDGVGTLYSASGTRVSVRVPDPNLD